MKRKFKWLTCSECGEMLERMYTNEELKIMYPVDDNIRLGNKRNDFNMKMYIYGKKLWICPVHGKSREITTKEFIRMVADFKMGKSIEYE